LLPLGCEAPIKQGAAAQPSGDKSPRHKSAQRCVSQEGPSLSLNGPNTENTCGSEPDMATPATPTRGEGACSRVGAKRPQNRGAAAQPSGSKLPRHKSVQRCISHEGASPNLNGPNTENTCGSEPARDSGGSADSHAGCAANFAIRLAPTGFTRFPSHPSRGISLQGTRRSPGGIPLAQDRSASRRRRVRPHLKSSRS